MASVGKYDVVHQTRNTSRIATPPEKDQPAAMVNTHRKFGEVWISGSGYTYGKFYNMFYFPFAALYFVTFVTFKITAVHSAPTMLAKCGVLTQRIL